MPRARLRLTVPEGVWVGDISRRHPEARFRVLAALPSNGSGVALVEISASDLAAVVTAMNETEGIVDFDVLHQREGTALVQFETSEPLLLTAVRESGVPLAFPFDLQDGEATWELTASHDRLSALGDRLHSLGIPFDVEKVGTVLDPDRLLTDRQRRLLAAAVEHGYYDTPRACSLTELAEHEEIAISTCSETLHRAESKLIKRFVQGPPDDPTIGREDL